MGNMLKIFFILLLAKVSPTGVFAENVAANFGSTEEQYGTLEFPGNLNRTFPDLQPIQFRVRVDSSINWAEASDPLLGIRLVASQDSKKTFRFSIKTEQGSISAHINSIDNLTALAHVGREPRFTISETKHGALIRNMANQPQREQENFNVYLHRDPEENAFSISAPGLEIHLKDNVAYGSVNVNLYNKETLGVLIGVIVRAYLIDIQKQSKIAVPLPVPPAPFPVPHPPIPAPQPKPCPACPEPFSRRDEVPPSRPHYPCPGTHTHYYVYHQGPPPDCICRKQEERVECN